VFGAKRHSTSEEVLTSLRRQATQTHGNGKTGGRGSFNNTVNMNTSFRSDRFNSDPTKNLTTEEKSTLNRPDEKVLSLFHSTSSNFIQRFLSSYSHPLCA
jgi:hypothetical protein